MDSDDISVPSRFELQVKYLCENENVDIVGGYLVEFDQDMENAINTRKVPLNHQKIEKMAKSRSPMNHGTVMFRRSSVLEAGNYRAVDRMEDYDLWIRMLQNDMTFNNIPYALLKARAGEEMYKRRGGLEYAREEVRRQTEFYEYGFINLPRLIFNIFTRVSLRLVPNQVRGKLYEWFAR